jgi:hypothetical protein
MWLRDLGLLAWFLVGVGLVLFGLVWLLALTSTIVMPVLVGAILATVAGPLVTKMHAVAPRAAGAASSCSGSLRSGCHRAYVRWALRAVVGDQGAASEAADKIEGWMNDAGRRDVA